MSALLKTLLNSLETFWNQPVAQENFAVGLQGWEARGQIQEGRVLGLCGGIPGALHPHLLVIYLFCKTCIISLTPAAVK